MIPMRALIEYTGITQVHSSCGSWKCDVTAAGNAVDFSYDEAMKTAISVRMQVRLGSLRKR